MDDTLHRGGWNFGTENWTEGLLLHGKFHPYRCKDKGIGPQNWKFYQNFTNFRNINALHGRTLARFLKTIYSVYSAIRDAKAVKIWIDLLKGLRSYGSFQLRVSSSPKFSAPLAAKVYIGLRLFQRCNNVLQVLYHHAKFRDARTARGVEDAKTFSCFLPATLRAAQSAGI